MIVSRDTITGVAPPFRITANVLRVSSEIERLVGKCEGLGTVLPTVELRRENRIRTIQGTVAIEGNSLTVDQVTAIVDGKRVRGPKREILEVRNALAAYELVPDLDPLSPVDLLRAHGVLMRGLVGDAGRWRSRNVGVLSGTRVAHVAPPPSRVPRLMKRLFEFVCDERTAPLLLRACVFHYELEFIHPFTDGNGRIGRLWQHVLLRSHSPVFAYVPVESLVKGREKKYYAALSASDRAGDSTAFLEFSLATLRDGLTDFLRAFEPMRVDFSARLDAASRHFERRLFSRKDYLELHPHLSTATASRDLKAGVQGGRLLVEGARATARYRFAGRR